MLRYVGNNIKKYLPSFVKIDARIYRAPLISVSFSTHFVDEKMGKRRLRRIKGVQVHRTSKNSVPNRILTFNLLFPVFHSTSQDWAKLKNKAVKLQSISQDLNATQPTDFYPNFRIVLE